MVFKKINIIIFILFGVTSAEVFDGLTLISNEDNDDNELAITQLIDNDENIINEWLHDTYLSGITYLASDSTLFISCKINNPNGPNLNGRFKKMNWEGEVIWEYIIPEELCRPHHDIEILPNGNILAICSEVKTYEELINSGMIIEEEPDINNNRGNMDMIVEIEPVGNNSANIVWKWYFWDHLIQDINSDFPNFGSISDNPQLLDINSPPSSFQVDNVFPPGADANDWMHCNSITYNSILDQIVLSSRNRSELYVIDHSTTIAEAASHFGGNSGMGGDFLYRWGNPQNYHRGDDNNQILRGQHSVVWIPETYPGESNFIIFNNFHTNNNSAVLEIIPPINEDGTYELDSISSYGPITYDWIYELSYTAAVRGGVWRLPNGNTIITGAGDLFEINASNEIEWIYNGNLSPTRVIKYSFDYFNLAVGDINEDGLVNILDIVQLVNMAILNEFQSSADLNYDNIVNILDIILLVNIILD